MASRSISEAFLPSTNPPATAVGAKIWYLKKNRQKKKRHFNSRDFSCPVTTYSIHNYTRFENTRVHVQMCENFFVFHWFKIVGNFLMLQTGKITKWRSTRDSKDTERYPPKKQKTKAKQQFPQQQETPKTLQSLHWHQIKPVTIWRAKKKIPVELHSKS